MKNMTIGAFRSELKDKIGRGVENHRRVPTTVTERASADDELEKERRLRNAAERGVAASRS